MVPSGLRPYPRMTMADLEKSVAAAAGSAWETAWEHSAHCSGDDEGYCKGGGSPLASHASSTTGGTNGVDVAAGVIASTSSDVTEPAGVQRPCCQLQCGGQLKVALHTGRRHPLPRPKRNHAAPTCVSRDGAFAPRVPNPDLVGLGPQNSTSQDDATGSNRLGLIESHRSGGRFVQELTDRGWRLCRDISSARCAAAVDRSGKTLRGSMRRGAVRSPPHSWRAAD